MYIVVFPITAKKQALPVSAFFSHYLDQTCAFEYDISSVEAHDGIGFYGRKGVMLIANGAQFQNFILKTFLSELFNRKFIHLFQFL